MLRMAFGLREPLMEVERWPLSHFNTGQGQTHFRLDLRVQLHALRP